MFRRLAADPYLGGRALPPDSHRKEAKSEDEIILGDGRFQWQEW